MKKYTTEELNKMDVVEVYKLVLEGDVVKQFPNGFFQRENTIENIIRCTKYLIEEHLKLTDEELKKQFSVSFMKKYKLGWAFSLYFGNSSYDLINLVYPNKFKVWELKKTPNGYWQDKQNGINAIKYVIEEKLKLTDEEIKQQISWSFFRKNGLGGMLEACFNGSPFSAINAAYPNKFKEWDFKFTPMGYWLDEENGIKATKWLIEEKLKLTDEQIKQQLSCNLFIENGLYGMLVNCFGNSPFRAIEATYPNKFKKSDFKRYR